MLLKELFKSQIEKNNLLFIEEWLNHQNTFYCNHFSYGFFGGDYIKGEIILNGEDGNRKTTIDGNQTAYLDSNDHTFVLFEDKNKSKGKLRFVEKSYHKFLTEKELNKEKKE